MNTEIWRHLFDAIEDSAHLHGKQLPVLLAGRAGRGAASASATKLQAKRREVLS